MPGIEGAVLRQRFRQDAREKVQEFQKNSPKGNAVSKSVNEVSHLSLVLEAAKIGGCGAIASIAIGKYFGLRSIGLLTNLGSVIGPLAMAYQASKLYKCSFTKEDLMIGGFSIGLLQSLFGMGFGAGFVFGNEANEGLGRLALCVGVAGSAILGSGAGEKLADSMTGLKNREKTLAIFGLIAGGYGGYRFQSYVYDLGVSYGAASSFISAMLMSGFITSVTDVALGFMFKREEMLSAIKGKLKTFRS